MGTHLVGAPIPKAMRKAIDMAAEQEREQLIKERLEAATCACPGCSNPPRPTKDPTRRPPKYCSNACKTRAWRQRNTL